MIPREVEVWLAENNHGAVKSIRSVGGGCINHGASLETVSGERFFLKTNLNSPPDMFAREAEGLIELRNGDGPRAPEPLVWGVNFLMLEDLRPFPPRPDYWPLFGQQMAALHLRTSDRFGFMHDNYIGSTPQPNPWTAEGFTFFGEQRLLFQARLAGRRDLLTVDQVRRVESLANRLPELVPPQPAALIHGDLWGGNAISDSDGGPAIIDPAAHYGWPEADLAMTSLFGAFPASFYRSYEEIRPLEKGWRERFPLYNLYHLLNHLNLFGTGYLGEVASILRRYS